MKKLISLKRNQRQAWSYLDHACLFEKEGALDAGKECEYTLNMTIIAQNHQNRKFS